MLSKQAPSIIKTLLSSLLVLVYLCAGTMFHNATRDQLSQLPTLSTRGDKLSRYNEVSDSETARVSNKRVSVKKRSRVREPLTCRRSVIVFRSRLFYSHYRKKQVRTTTRFRHVSCVGGHIWHGAETNNMQLPRSINLHYTP